MKNKTHQTEISTTGLKELTYKRLWGKCYICLKYIKDVVNISTRAIDMEEYKKRLGV